MCFVHCVCIHLHSHSSNIMLTVCSVSTQRTYAQHLFSPTPNHTYWHFNEKTASINLAHLVFTLACIMRWGDKINTNIWDKEAVQWNLFSLFNGTNQIFGMGHHAYVILTSWNQANFDAIYLIVFVDHINFKQTENGHRNWPHNQWTFFVDKRINV